MPYYALVIVTEQNLKRFDYHNVDDLVTLYSSDDDYEVMMRACSYRKAYQDDVVQVIRVTEFGNIDAEWKPVRITNRIVENYLQDDTNSTQALPVRLEVRNDEIDESVGIIKIDMDGDLNETVVNAIRHVLSSTGYDILVS